MKIFTPLFFFALIATVTTYAQEFDYSFKETYEVSTPAKLDLSSSDGNLDIIPSDGNKIQVYYIAKKGGKLLKIDRKELEEELIVETDHTSNSLKISVRNKKQFSHFNFEFSIGVHFKVYIPRETSCSLATSDGSITMEGLTGDQLCKTSDGHLRIANISGNVRGRTSDGDVSVKQIKGLVNVGTSDGTIELESIGGDVEASTSDGNIKLNKVKGDIAVKTSDGYIDFKEISGSFRASTSD